MSQVHRVREGECLTQIAYQYGYTSYRPIYDHPSNTAFRKKRPDPNILHPGDLIIIPDLNRKELPCNSGQTHVFLLGRPTRVLKIRVLDVLGEPHRSTPYRLTAGDTVCEATTSADGLLEQRVPVDVKTCTLELADVEVRIDIAHLNPMEEVGNDVSGIQGRLHNLGFYDGPIDGGLGQQTQAAIKSFQHRHGLDVSGEPSPSLIAKLKEEYGC